MRMVIALGGNALLRRGEPMTAENRKSARKRVSISIGDPVASSLAGRPRISPTSPFIDARLSPAGNWPSR